MNPPLPTGNAAAADAPPAVPTIAQVALPAAVDRLFDYRIPAMTAPRPGSLVQVSLAGKRHTGVVVGVTTHSEVDSARLLPLDSVYPQPPLPEDVRRLVSFVSDYYQSPLGMAYGLAVPSVDVRATPPKTVLKTLALTAAGREMLAEQRQRLGNRAAPALRAFLAEIDNSPITVEIQAAWTPAQRKHARTWRENGWLTPADARVAESPPLRAEQQAAVDAVRAAFSTFAPFLLQGITGSGKTEVYLTLAREAIAQGGQVLVLLPEIHLTPQFLARVQRLLPAVDVALLNSALPDGERLHHWQRAAAGEAQLVLGTRLAVFTPLPWLALIVVDEEHDPSFKQQDNVRYHARDLAVWRAHDRNVPIVLGSATPSLESYHHAQSGRYRHLRIRQRADPQAMLPCLTLVPVRTGNGDDADAHEGIAPPLWEALRIRLARHEQSLIFINRRGFSPSLKCNACTWEAQCPRCAVRLVLHKHPPLLRCHHCGYTLRVPAHCPSCGNLDLLPRGHGTQRLEAALAAAFPQARIARIDRDTTRRRDAFSALHAQITGREIDILIGTQMLAKGHDFPRVTLVGVLGADNALYSADFRATERLAALLHQVAGRAGRADLAGEVIVQTDFPRHPLFATLVRHDYDAFAQTLLDERRAAHLPPFSSLALLSAEARDPALLATFLRDAHDEALRLCEASGHAAVHVFAPLPAALSRRADQHRAQIVAQSADRRALHALLAPWRAFLDSRKTRQVRWAIDVDPLHL